MSNSLFEYKVRARHRLGWKEFSFYATTEIEEFLNRNSIEYVRNMTDTVEHRLLKEIDKLVDTNEDINREFSQYKYESKKEIKRLNNIIKRFEEDLREVYLTFGEFSEEYTENIIKKLKGEDKE